MQTISSLLKKYWSLHPRHRIELALLVMVAVFVTRWSILPALQPPMFRLMFGTAYAQELTFGETLPDFDIKLRFPEADRTDYDLDKLAWAVAVAETSGCRDGTARGRNNCHGILRIWIDENGVRQRAPRYYKNTEQSFSEFKRIWKTYYKAFPDYQLAKKYTGNDNTVTWLKNVCSVYPHPSCS